MITESLASLVDKVIGKTGQLRSPAWWIHRIFSKVGEELSALKDKVSVVDNNAKYIDTIEPLIDSYFSQPIEFEATYNGTLEYKYGNLYGDDNWVEKQASASTDTTEKFKFYGNLNFYNGYYYNSGLKTLTLPSGTLFLYAEKMFYGYPFLKTLELPDYVKLGANAGYMFFYCKALTTLDVSGWDVSKVTNMGSMFKNCNALTTLDVSGWDVSKVTSMSSMFSSCNALTTLDVSGWDVSKVTSMSYMFYYCKALTTLDVSGWDVSKVTSMRSMFSSCNALTAVTGSITGISVSLDLKSCPLTNESAMVFINGLAEVTSAKTITFKATTYETLTEAQIAIATSKGWTVASA